MDWQEKHEELIRLRQEAESWKEQCARVEENERALMKQSKELEAQLREKQEELEDLQALEAELKRFEQFLEMHLEDQAPPGRDSSASGQRGDATEGLGTSGDYI